MVDLRSNAWLDDMFVYGGTLTIDRFEPWLETMYFHCSSELYDLDRLKAYLAENEGKEAFLKRRFEEVLAERPFTAPDWERGIAPGGEAA